MTTQDLRLLPVVVAMWMGAALGLHVSELQHRWWMWSALAVPLWGLRRWRHAQLCVAASALALLVAALRIAGAAPAPVLADLADAGAVSFEAVVDAEPTLRATRAFGGLEMQERVRAHVTLVRLRMARRVWAVSMPATVEWPAGPPPPTVGARIAGTAVAHVDDIPGRSVLRFRLQEAPDAVAPPTRGAAVATAIRHGLAKAASQRVHGDGSALLPGLVLGDTRAQSRQLVDDLRTSGLSHLTAVSGANVAIVLSAVVWLLQRMGTPRRRRYVVAGLVLLGFIVVVQPQPSVLRAAVMGGVALFALATGRRRESASALWLTIALLLVIDPFLAWQFGFALSVAATGGLILLRPWLVRWLPGGWIGDALVITLSAQLATFPILLMMDRPPTWASIPANLLAEPMVAAATISGFVAAVLAALSLLPVPLLSPLLLELAGLAALPGVLLATLIARIAAVAAASPFATAPITSFAMLSCVMLVVALAVRIGLRPRVLLACMALYAVVSSCAPNIVHRWPPADWEYAMCDVGQGDASVLNLGQGRALVIDAGPDPRAARRCLAALGVRQVAALFVTHFHADHVEGVAGVAQAARVERVFATPLHAPESEWRRVREVLPMPMRELRAGDRLAFGSTEVRVLWPDPDALDGSPNNGSLVLDIRHRGLRLLLTGDADPAAQADIHLPISGFDVLKVPHHASRYQDPAFLRTVRPALALVSVGEGNDYGHPAVGTVDLLRRRGARVLRTDLSGSIAVSRIGGRLEWTTQ